MIESEKDLQFALAELGVSESEVKVFCALVRLGKRPVTLLSRAAGKNRAYTYQVLRRLALKELVLSEMRRGVRYFFAIPIEALIDRLEHRNRALARSTATLKLILSNEMSRDCDFEQMPIAFEQERKRAVG